MDFPSTRRPTIIDVAREAGVSPGTVSNALSERRPVEPDTKARVHAAVKALGYSPNTRAQRLRGGSAGAIGLFITLPFAQAAGPTRFGFAMEVAAVAASIAAEKELALILAPPMHDAHTVPHFLDMDGALFIEPVAGNPLTAGLRRRGIPVVTIGPEPGLLEQAFVDLQTRDTMTMLLHHLVERGSRRIALMTSRHRHDVRAAALERYERFVAETGMSPVIVELEERQGQDGARHSAQQLLAAAPEIDGILAPYDPFAIGCRKALGDLARDRRTVRIATRYNSIGAQENQITAVDLHLGDAAGMAVRLLLEQMSDGSAPQRIASPAPTLLPRASTA